MAEQKPYVEWQSAISPEEVFSEAIGISEVKTVDDATYWLELRSAEKGRYTIMRRDVQGKITEVLPKEYSARTKVHEYGGGSYNAHPNFLLFSNFSDERLYKLDFATGKVYPLTPAKNKDGSTGKYAHMIITPDGASTFFVYEKDYEEKENVNCLAMLDLRKSGEHEPTVLAGGKDFYGDPCYHQGKLAWMEWSHPYMPWESTYLKIAECHGDHLHHVHTVAGGETTSICVPKFSPDGTLYFAMDEEHQQDNDPKNWWNLYRYVQGNVEPVTQELAEFGDPHWVFGGSVYDFDTSGNLITCFVKDGDMHVAVIDQSNVMKLVPTPFSFMDYLTINQHNEVYYVAASFTTVAGLYKHDLKTGKTELIKAVTSKKLDDNDVSIPKHITWTINGATAHGYLYLPKNSKYTAPTGDLPPLIVMVHGGPTGSARALLRYSLQYWTTSGFAILDVNYRGSVGYGRRFRDALKHQWGVVDNDDVAHGAEFLIKQGIVNPKQIVITGGSAGGYAVQRALTTRPNLWAAGASHFGIGNLLTFDSITHKFESRYDHNFLLGKTPQEDPELYKERSPFFFLDRIKAPMILFQGADDKIVPPECSREVYDALNKQGIMTEYHEYAGEAHGFRKKENNVEALQKEHAFYKKVFAMGGAHA